MSYLFNEDMTYCKSECDDYECCRNVTGIKIPAGIHSFADMKGTLDCPKRTRTVTLCGECEFWNHECGYVGSCNIHKCLFRETDFCSYGKKTVDPRGL